MTNNQGNSIGLTIMLIILIVILLSFSSCCINKLTTEQLSHRNKIHYEMEKLWDEYQYKIDSLTIEYNKK